MPKTTIKSKAEIEAMIEGGRKLGEIKGQLAEAVKPGVNAAQIEDLAPKLIKESQGVPSFKMVPGYSWSTCVNVNDGIVHGIPHKSVVFGADDIVSIDVGLYYDNLHTDTAITVYLGQQKAKKQLLAAGQEALTRAIDEVQVGNKIGDISRALEETVKHYGYKPVRALTGHGVGRNLHE